MPKRLFMLLVVAIAMAMAPVRAAERMPYTSEAFDAALASGKPILVHITAPWCGECKQQKPIVARLAGTPEFANLVIIDVDFDTQKDALRRLRAQKQATLIAFKDRAEVGRAVGITRAQAIEAVMKKAL